MKRLLSAFIILSTVFFTGCWSSREVNTLAITICIGIDKTENGYLISAQVINPKSIASKKATNESPVVLYTAEGQDIDETIHKLTTQSSRIIYSSHLRMVVFGEDVAKDGIQDILDYFARNREYRTDFYFAIAKNATASEILSVLTPIESIPGIDMYNSLTISNEEWATTKSIRLAELVNSINANGKNPVITGVEIAEGERTPNSIDTLKESSKVKKLVYIGLGAFKEDRLAGWLNEDESKGYNYIAGDIKRTIGYVNYGDNVQLTNEVMNAQSTVKASIVNGKPAVDVEIKVTQSIKAVKGEFDVSKEENLKIINKLAEEKIKMLCEKALNKAQNELKTDIFGFGETIHRKYPMTWGKMKKDWDNEFVSLPVNITVEVNTNSLGQITKPFFIKEKE